MEKEKINALWEKTKLGEFILLVANGKNEEAEEMNIQAFEDGCLYGVFDEAEELSERIIEAVGTAEIWNNYLATLDENILEAIYKTRAFSYVDSYFM